MSNGTRSMDWATVFQSAALEPRRWMDALRALADATGSAHAQLIGVGHAGAVPFNWVSDISADAVSDFARRDMASPAVNSAPTRICTPNLARSSTRRITAPRARG